MKRTTELTVGVAAAALTIASPAAAVTWHDRPIPPAASYSDLFEPVADASSRLAAADEAMAAGEGQYAVPYGGQAHHHHHHHHHHSRRWYRSRGYVWNGGAWMPPPPPPRAHHHHHHHHHHSNY